MPTVHLSRRRSRAGRGFDRRRLTAPAAPTTRPASERYYVSETWHSFSGTPG